MNLALGPPLLFFLLYPIPMGKKRSERNNALVNQNRTKK